MSEMIKSHLETREGRLQGVLRKLFLLRDGPLENFLGRGGGGAGEEQKKKNKEYDNEKKFLWLQNPPPPP